MAKLKNFDEFCNESLILSSEYNYYGPGSLVPLIQQLVREGKDSSIIRSYLTSLGVDAWRIDKAMSEFEVAFGGEKKVNESVNEAKATFEETANKFLSELNEEDKPKKATFEDAANAFLLDLPGSDEVTEKLNKETLQVEEGDGEDIDDMIDDLEDGDEDTYQGDDDNAPDDSPEDKIKAGESPEDAVEDDNASPKDKLEQAAKELAKDSKKLEKIKKILGEADTITVDDDGEEVKDKEGIEDAKTGDDIEVEETFGMNIPKDGAKSEEDFQAKQKKLTETENIDPWKPAPGLFMQPATKIAKCIMEGAESLDQAIARFDTHAEKVKPLLGNADKQNLEMVKPLLEKRLG